MSTLLFKSIETGILQVILCKPCTWAFTSRFLLKCSLTLSGRTAASPKMPVPNLRASGSGIPTKSNVVRHQYMGISYKRNIASEEKNKKINQDNVKDIDDARNWSSMSKPSPKVYLMGMHSKKVIREYENSSNTFSHSWWRVVQYIVALWVENRDTKTDDERMFNAFQMLYENDLLEHLQGINVNDILFIALDTKNTGSKVFFDQLAEHCALTWHDWPLHLQIQHATLWLLLSKKHNHLYMKDGMEVFFHRLLQKVPSLSEAMTVKLSRIICNFRLISINLGIPLDRKTREILRDLACSIEWRLFKNENVLAHLHILDLTTILRLSNHLRRTIPVEILTSSLNFLMVKYEASKLVNSGESKELVDCAQAALEAMGRHQTDRVSHIALLSSAADLVQGLIGHTPLSQNWSLVYSLTKHGYCNHTLLDELLSSFQPIVKNKVHPTHLTLISKLLQILAAVDHKDSPFLDTVNPLLLSTRYRLALGNYPYLIPLLLNSMLCLGVKNCDGLLDLLFSKNSKYESFVSDSEHPLYKGVPLYLNAVYGHLEVEGVNLQAARIPRGQYEMPIMKQVLTDPNLIGAKDREQYEVMLAATQQLFEGSDKARVVTLPYLKNCHLEFCLDSSGVPVDLIQAGIPSLVDSNGRINMDSNFKMAGQSKRVAVVLEKEEHFFVNNGELNGFEKRRRRHLNLLGYHHMVTVPTKIAQDKESGLISHLRQEFQKIQICGLSET